MIAGLVSPKQTVYAEEEIKTRTVYLSDLEWESATKGCDDKEIEKDRSWLGKTITLLQNGEEKTFSKGIEHMLHLISLTILKERGINILKLGWV